MSVSNAFLGFSPVPYILIIQLVRMRIRNKEVLTLIAQVKNGHTSPRMDGLMHSDEREFYGTSWLDQRQLEPAADPLVMTCSKTRGFAIPFN